MVTTPVGPKLAVLIVAAPGYLQRRGVPEHPKQLLDHDCVRYPAPSSGTLERWSFAKDGEELGIAVSGRLVVNDSEALVHAALDGVGIVYTISGDAAGLVRAGKLIRILPDWSPELPGFRFYHPSRQRAFPSLRALLAFVREESSKET